MFRLRKNIVFVLVAISLLVAACSPSVRYKIMDTIFDDVPVPVDENVFVADTVIRTDSVTVASLAMELEKVYYHEPFVEKECGKCHDEQHLGQLVAEEPELCKKCHEVKFENNTFQHGPSDAGFCTSCHRPHKSASPNLLTQGGNSLCYTCHETEDVENSTVHKELSDSKDCITCHDPHSSDKRFMIKKGVCNTCHEEVDENKFTHGPVAAGFCSSCHESHESTNTHLLAKNGQELCFSCHDSKLILNDKVHVKEKGKQCTDCHDPHGGSKKFMLN